MVAGVGVSRGLVPLKGLGTCHSSAKMSDALEEAVLDNFTAVTGASKERATFYLASAGWDLQTALDSFYDGEHGDNAGGEEVLPETEPAVTVPPETEDGPSGSQLPPALAKGNKGGFATLFDYQKEEQPGDDEDSEKFYAGGSEHSGQLIAGPPRKKPTAESLAKDVFEAAKKQGAVKVEDEEQLRQQQKSQSFRGAGFRLGESEGPSQKIGTGAPYKEPEKVQHVLAFWSNGFAVDDGPLRTGESEEDKRFLASVSKGEIPQELVHAAKGGEVDIHIEDRRNEPYVQRKPKMVVFSGAGQKLGSLTPEVISHKPTLEPTEAAAPKDPSPPTIPLDPSQPTTSIQIRLADGTRLVAKFNHSHTVNDVRQYINLSRPAMSSSNYILLTTFPNRELTNPSQTLAEANLLNAVVVQRMK